MDIEGPELQRLAQAAKENQIIVSIGFNESTRFSVGTIYNSNVIIGRDGELLNHHRKLVPTFYEKLTWAPGDGAGLQVCQTEIGNVGMLICGENTNPLARYTLMAQGEQIHIASYPPIWPTHGAEDGVNYDLAHAIRLRAGAHSFEAKAFTLVVSGYLDNSMLAELSAITREAAELLDASPRGVSLATNPAGQCCSDELCSEEGLLYVEADLSECVIPKQFHDISGGYNRFDVFELHVDRARREPANFLDENESNTNH